MFPPPHGVTERAEFRQRQPAPQQQRLRRRHAFARENFFSHGITSHVARTLSKSAATVNTGNVDDRAVCCELLLQSKPLFCHGFDK
jgi:hypothetical protein